MNQRNHHYIPRCYLKRFCKQTDKQFIAIYNNQDNSCNENDIKNILSERGFYEIPKEFAENGDTEALENMFADIEKLGCPVLEKIQRAKSISLLTLDDWDKIYIFMALQWTRTPRWQLENSMILPILISSSDDLVNLRCKILRLREYELLKTKQCFISSDNPISFTDMSNLPEKIYNNPLYGRYLYKALIYPLSSKLCLIGYAYPDLINKHNIVKTINKPKELNQKETDEINNIISQSSYQYIFAKDKQTLENVVKRSFRKEKLESLW